MNYFQDNARATSLRIADFFCVVDIDEELIPFCHATRLLGIDQLTCTEVPFAAKVSDRYPLVDRADAVFPEGVELFCFPSGVRLVEQCPPPGFHSFIHTSEEGTHSLGCCLVFYEPLSPSLQNRFREAFLDSNSSSSGIGGGGGGGVGIDGTRGTHVDGDIDFTKLLVPRSICVISRWPFIESFRMVYFN